MSEKKLSIAINRVLFWAGVLFSVIAPLYIGLGLKNINMAWLSLLCGAFVTLMTKYEDIIEFSFGPVKARMRETIRQANATIDQLQKVALSYSTTMLTDLMAGNFMSGTTLENRLNLHDSIIETLRDIGLSDSAIDQAEQQWKKGIGVIYHRIILHTLEGRKKPHEINPETPKEVMELSKEIQEMLDFDHWLAPTPDEIESRIEKRGLMKPEVKEWISDYRHYRKTGEIRRRELFVQN